MDCNKLNIKKVSGFILVTETIKDENNFLNIIQSKNRQHLTPYKYPIWINDGIIIKNSLGLSENEINNRLYN